MNNKKQLKNWLVIFLVLVLFVAAGYFSQRYTGQFKRWIGGGGILSMGIYIFITVLAIVIAPLGIMPLVPVAGNMWGWFLGGLLSIVGWSIGGLLAFLLARRYGYPIVQKVTSIKKIQQISGSLPKRVEFWTIVLLRLSSPVDVLSYALGLFTRVNVWTYFWATLIGVAPFGFLFAYAGTAPLWFMILAVALGALAAVVGGKIAHNKYQIQQANDNSDNLNTDENS